MTALPDNKQIPRRFFVTNRYHCGARRGLVANERREQQDRIFIRNHSKPFGEALWLPDKLGPEFSMPAAELRNPTIVSRHISIRSTNKSFVLQLRQPHFLAERERVVRLPSRWAIC
ncbi:MAG TPA: hypothetical protein VIT91_18555 [Chthoniobacterales bacterium]